MLKVTFDLLLFIILHVFKCYLSPLSLVYIVYKINSIVYFLAIQLTFNCSCKYSFLVKPMQICISHYLYFLQ